MTHGDGSTCFQWKRIGGTNFVDFQERKEKKPCTRRRCEEVLLLCTSHHCLPEIFFFSLSLFLPTSFEYILLLLLLLVQCILLLGLAALEVEDLCWSLNSLGRIEQEGENVQQQQQQQQAATVRHKQGLVRWEAAWEGSVENFVLWREELGWPRNHLYRGCVYKYLYTIYAPRAW